MADLREVGATHDEGDGHLREFSNLLKEFVITYRSSVGIASKLPGAMKRDGLEKMCWRAVQQAMKYSVSESAAFGVGFPVRL